MGTDTSNLTLDDEGGVFTPRLSYFGSFSCFAAALIVLGLAHVGYLLVTVPEAVWTDHAARVWIRVGGMAVAAASAGGWLLFYRKRLHTRPQLALAFTLLIMLVGALLIASRLVLERAFPDRDLAAWAIVDLAVIHFAACLLMPLTPKESINPFILLLVLWAAAMLVPEPSRPDILDRVVGVVISPGILIPGALVAAWKTQRRREDLERLMLGEQIRTIGGELSKARIVHDAMFPAPSNDGHVGFEYEYVPIAEIGGDYVHFHTCGETGRVYLTLLDVAGHGLAAALTVNRLFGEIERIRAENPHASPADIMVLLNRYIFLTMARHSMYATGACFMLDPNTGELVWVNAGHPPALLRRGNGSVGDVEGTTLLLGAEPPERFDANQQSMRLAPGDVVIAYTDGVFEARNPDGRRFGIDNLRNTVRFDPPPRSWTKFIAHAVAKHHDGNPEDDVLIATLTLNSLRVASPAGRAELVANS